MVRDPRLLARLARLSAEIAIDTAALVARAEETSVLLGAWGSKAALGRAELTLVAANLHGYYTALETRSERVARQLDEHVPAGATWHIDLLSQMQTEVPLLRPASAAATRTVFGLRTCGDPRASAPRVTARSRP